MLFIGRLYGAGTCNCWHYREFDESLVTSVPPCKMAGPHRRLIIFIYISQSIIYLLAANLSHVPELQTRTLYIGSMAPMTGKRAWWGAGIPLAIEMAFEDINSRSDVLRQYRLELIRRDTQVSQQLAPTTYILLVIAYWLCSEHLV